MQVAYWWWACIEAFYNFVVVKLQSTRSAKQGCGSRSGFNRVIGSGFPILIRIRIQEGENDPKKFSNFQVLDLKASSVTWTFFMEA